MSKKEIPPMSHPKTPEDRRKLKFIYTYSLTGRRMSPSRRKLFSGVSSGMSPGKDGRVVWAQAPQSTFSRKALQRP